MVTVGFVGGASALQVARGSRARAAAVSVRMSRGGNAKFGGFGRGLFGGSNGNGSGKRGDSGRGGSGGAGGAGKGGNGGSARGAGQGGESGAGGNPLLSLWNAYNAQLVARPILTKALTSFVGFALGDILAQNLLNKNAPFDSQRLLRMSLFGLLVHGPTGHFFYNALDRVINGTEAWKVVTKVAIDQILWAPIFTVMFFAFIGALEGKSVDNIVSKVKRDTWSGVTGSWKVWPLVHTINFRFIPTAQRLLYINAIQIVYNVFLSFLGNKGETK
mmetsp:Transcript_911/g.2497  ORF Transcript_911/g.2497 Transcript_911/m.2497 type:complete len:274 (-) Transcript_911:1458-2279(-)